MKVTKRTIPTLTLIVMASQLFGCGAANDEQIATNNTEQGKITKIEAAYLIYNSLFNTNSKAEVENIESRAKTLQDSLNNGNIADNNLQASLDTLEARGIIDSTFTSNWNKTITKTEAINLIFKALEVYNTEQGTAFEVEVQTPTTEVEETEQVENKDSANEIEENSTSDNNNYNENNYNEPTQSNIADTIYADPGTTKQDTQSGSNWADGLDIPCLDTSGDKHGTYDNTPKGDGKYHPEIEFR